LETSHRYSYAACVIVLSGTNLFALTFNTGFKEIWAHRGVRGSPFSDSDAEDKHTKMMIEAEDRMLPESNVPGARQNLCYID
jgi:hypothetical protein